MESKRVFLVAHLLSLFKQVISLCLQIGIWRWIRHLEETCLVVHCRRCLWDQAFVAPQNKSTTNKSTSWSENCLKPVFLFLPGIITVIIHLMEFSWMLRVGWFWWFFLGGRLNVQQWCNPATKDAFLTSVAMINQHIGITLHWSCGLGKTPLSHV